MIHYILDEKRNIVPCSLLQWAEWLEKASNRIVKYDKLCGDVAVSTVFLGLNYNWGDGPPILWETMVFGGTLDREMDRCAGGIEQAEAMHEAMLARVLLTV